MDKQVNGRAKRTDRLRGNGGPRQRRQRYTDALAARIVTSSLERTLDRVTARDRQHNIYNRFATGMNSIKHRCSVDQSHIVAIIAARTTG